MYTIATRTLLYTCNIYTCPRRGAGDGNERVDDDFRILRFESKDYVCSRKRVLDIYIIHIGTTQSKRCIGVM